MKKVILDQEEKDILEAFDNGEFKSVRNKKAEMARLKKVAVNTMQKNKRINIRLVRKGFAWHSNKSCRRRPHPCQSEVAVPSGF